MKFLIGVMRNYSYHEVNDLAVVLNTSRHPFAINEKYDDMELDIRAIVRKQQYGVYTPLEKYELTSDVFDLYYEYDTNTDKFTYVGRHDTLRDYLKELR